MKTLTKATAFFLSALLCLGGLAACTGQKEDSEQEESEQKEQESEKTPTPEEIYGMIEELENGKILIEQKLTSTPVEGMSLEAVVRAMAEKAGDLGHAVITAKLLGSEQTEETYHRKLNGKSYTYTKDEETGLWVEKESDADEDEDGDDGSSADADDFAALFSSDLYGDFDQTARRYTLKPDCVNRSLTVSGDPQVLQDAYIEIGDASYTLTARLTAEQGEVLLTIALSDLGQVNITLPAGIDAPAG